MDDDDSDLVSGVALRRRSGQSTHDQAAKVIVKKFETSAKSIANVVTYKMRGGSEGSMVQNHPAVNGCGDETDGNGRSDKQQIEMTNIANELPNGTLEVNNTDVDGQGDNQDVLTNGRINREDTRSDDDNVTENKIETDGNANSLTENIEVSLKTLRFADNPRIALLDRLSPESPRHVENTPPAR